MKENDLSDLATASGMERHANCPGNRILIRSLKDRGLLGKEDLPPEATVGQKIHAALEGLPEDLTHTEANVKNECEKLAAKVKAQFFFGGQEYTCVGKGLPFLQADHEKRLTYREGGVPFFSGKPDLVYRTEDRALDINYKTGRKESPDSSLNLQLRAEVALIYHLYRTPKVAAAIVEPLVSQTPEIVIYEESDLKAATREILEIVDKTEWETNRHAGSWCIHCPARAFCPDAKALALREPLYYHVDSLPRGERAGELLEKIEWATKVFEAIRKQYKRIVAEELNSVPGWHISKPREMRYIDDPGAALLAMTEQGTDGRHLVEEKIAIGKLEAFMAAFWQMGGGKEFDRKFASVFRDAIKIHTTSGRLEKIPKRLKD